MNILLLITVIVAAIASIIAAAKTVQCNNLNDTIREKDAQIKEALTELENEKSHNDKLSEQLEEKEAAVTNAIISGKGLTAIAKELSARLKESEADRIELRAERATLENQLDAAKRVRNAKGIFVRKDGTYTPKEKIKRFDAFKVKPLPTIADEVVELTGIARPVTVQDVAKALVPKPHTLRYGMTVKNPTEKEAKEIFEAARVAGIESISSAGNVSLRYPDIWYCEGAGYNNGVCDCTMDGHGKGVVTSSEFIARIKGEVG